MIELLYSILDTLRHGDPLGHLRAWWEVITGTVTLETCRFCNGTGDIRDDGVLSEEEMAYGITGLAPCECRKLEVKYG